MTNEENHQYLFQKRLEKVLPIQIKAVILRPIETVEVEKQSHVRFTLR
jgi:hypothetical protein